MSQRGFVKKRGSSWTAYWKADTANDRRQRTRGGFATRKEAQTFLTSTLATLQTGTFTEPSKITVREYLVDRWLPGRVTSLRPSTLENYRCNVKRHIVPAVGHLRLQRLTVDDLDLFYAEMLNSGLAPKTVRNVHTTLRKALQDAVRKNLVLRNVADAADAPKLARPGEREMKTWTPDQLRAFFDGISRHRLAVAYVVSATTGMRRGEVLGLRWSDVDLVARRISVAHTVLSVSYQIIPGTPKTARGRRSITLDAHTVALLDAHRTRQRADQEAAGRRGAAEHLVFPRDDGSPVHPDSYSQTFDRTVRRLGLPKIRLHDLRHTHATLGLAAGVPVKIMSERLGHSTSAFTQDVYIHAIPALEVAAADQIGSIMFGPDDETEGRPEPVPGPPGDKSVTTGRLGEAEEPSPPSGKGS